MADSSVLTVRGTSSENWIVTTAIGGGYLQNWERDFLPSWNHYAVRHDIGIAVVVGSIFSEDEPSRNGAWQKLLAPRELRRLLARDVRCLLLDSDVLVSPGAPNIFDAVPSEALGVVSQEHGVPLGTPLEVRKQMAYLRKTYMDSEFPLVSALLAGPADRAEWAGLSPLSDYFCSGVILCDTEIHSEVLMRWYVEAPSTPPYIGTAMDH